jgi:hypothetical protein
LDAGDSQGGKSNRRANCTERYNSSSDNAVSEKIRRSYNAISEWVDFSSSCKGRGEKSVARRKIHRPRDLSSEKGSASADPGAT